MTTRSGQRVFDCDVHHQYPSLDSLRPYLADGDIDPYYTHGSALHNLNGAYRLDAIPPGGGVPGSDPQFVAEHHLDRHGIDGAILNPAGFLGLGGLPDADLAAALARATNDWTINEWLPVDDRFYGAILVSLRDPDQAADEIRRLGGHPRMLQVTVTSSPWLLGSRALDPVYAACNEHGLPFNIHVGGAETGVNPGSYSVGNPTTMMEYHIGMCVPAIQHLISWITEGVPVQYPRVKLVLNEFGVAWLPWAVWRLDMEYRASKDTPWLTRAPSEYIADHVRLTTQPLEEPRDRRDLFRLLDMIDGSSLLLFSSDYPHWDADDPDSAGLRAMPEEWRPKVFWENAAALYGLSHHERHGLAPA